jgi:hypothetical protein
MGAYFGEPIDVVACQTIDLQVPASAEIVIEGYVSHDETAMEGPMGEYAGYADTCRGEPPRGCGAFPGAAQVSGQRPGEAQLGMTGEDQPVGCQKSAWPMSCSDAPGSAAGHDDQSCLSVCPI